MVLAHSRRLLAVGVGLFLGGTLFASIGGVSGMARAGEASLEFVGNLINGVRNIDLNRLDPTYPRCF